MQQMDAREAILRLYEEFGPPELADFALDDLGEGQDWMAGAFVLADRNGEVVLIRRTPIKEYPGIENLWWLPGGGHETGEKLQETAVREFEEETGLKVSIHRLLTAQLSRERPFVAICFRGSVSGGRLSHGVDPDRITAEARAFPPGEIPYDAMWGDVERILLVREGFVDRNVDDLIQKEALTKP